MVVTLEESQFQYDDGRTTNYLAAGPRDGPLMIFIHGWPAIAKVWKPQLETFASLGFRAVAPDMPGYGKSTARKVVEDYAQENISRSMVALLEHLGREKAVWIGHDWGAPAVWTFAAHYPEKCVGVVGMAVPYRSLELGLEEVVKTVNRDIYPEDQFPYGQWSYQRFYEENFEKAAGFFDSDPESVLRMFYSKQDPAYLTPAFTATVVEDGGWFGGLSAPDSAWKEIPSEKMLIDEETFQELVAAMKRNGFWTADAWYLNHKRNRAYSLEKWKNDGYLHKPVLFIEAKFDPICATSCSTLGHAMREYCTQLTECSIDSGHWVAEEKPQETSAAIARWLIENCVQYWPGYWSNPHVTRA